MLHQNKLLNKSNCEWLMKCFYCFARIMRNGPEQPPPQDGGEYALMELSVRWMLKLATMENLSVDFTEFQ